MVRALSKALAAVIIYECLESKRVVGDTTIIASETLCLVRVSFSLILKAASILGESTLLPYKAPGC